MLQYSINPGFLDSLHKSSVLIAYGHIYVKEDIFQHTVGLPVCSSISMRFLSFSSFITLFKILSRTSRNNRGDRRQSCLTAYVVRNGSDKCPLWYILQLDLLWPSLMIPSFYSLGNLSLCQIGTREGAYRQFLKSQVLVFQQIFI
jgi:hypothetical protein